MIYHVKLQKGEIWKPTALDRGAFKVLTGTAWVTYKGIAEDFIFTAGEKFPPSHNEMVVEALDELTLELLSARQVVLESSSL